MNTTNKNAIDTAAAAQVLYAAADATDVIGRRVLFNAIHHLTGKPVAQIEQLWKSTR